VGRYDDRLVVGASGNKNCQNLFAGTSSGNKDLGSNESYNTQEFYLGTTSGNKRITRNRQDVTNYGDKQLYIDTSGGYAILYPADRFCMNANTSNFALDVSSCMKDYDNDKLIMTCVAGSSFWSLYWLGDGRLRWQTRYNGGTTFTSYSSVRYYANTWVRAEIYINKGASSGSMWFNGNWTSCNNSGRFEYSSSSNTIGSWGMLFRGYIRCRGVKYSGIVSDYTHYINNMQVQRNPSGWNADGSSMGTSGANCTQDTWITTNWV